MLTRLIKILLAASSLAYTVYLFSIAQTGAAIGMIFVTIILVVMTLKSMRLVLAFVQIRQQKMPEAKKWLGRTNKISFGLGREAITTSCWVVLPWRKI